MFPPIEIIKCADDIVNRAMYSTAIYVGEGLLQQESFLLPSVHEIFHAFAAEVAHMANLDFGESENLVTARWLLSNLVVCLQHHLAYACRVRKHGTLLYRSNGDFLASLSLALYKGVRRQDKHDSTYTCTCTCKCTCTRTESSVVQSAVQSAIQDDINTRVHQQIQKFLAADLNVAYPFDKVDIDRLVSEIDPQLWAFITSITRSISERKGYNVKTNQPETLAYHVKKVRCLFCLCTLMFCADDRCSVPFHTLISDTIESCGGSTQLIRILNRLGVCSSADTLARSIQSRVQEREKKGPEQDCARNAPTLISTDNIDFQHSYARVFCGKQTSNWHGTTVQAVQPRLSAISHYGPGSPTQVDRLGAHQHVPTSTHGMCTAVSHTNESSNVNKHSACAILDRSLTLAGRKRSAKTRSPYPSPQKDSRSPLPEIRRRARTGKEGVTTPLVPSPVRMPTAPSSHVEGNTCTLDLQRFRLSVAEVCAVTQLREEMDTYILQKHANGDSSETNQTILNIQDYMTVISPVTSEKSNVVYLRC